MRIITVTSDPQNPSSFTSDFLDSVQLSENYEVALMKIAHGPVANLTNENNAVHLHHKALNQIVATVKIPQGYYKSTHDILLELHKQLNQKHMITMYDIIRDDDDEDSTPIPPIDFTATVRYKNVGTSDILTITLKDTNLQFYSGSEFYSGSDFISSALVYLNYKIDHFASRSLNVTNYELKPSDTVGFVYSSIVSHSMFNNMQSRLLASVPIVTDDGYSFYEPINPIFTDMSVSSFIGIEFKILNVNGGFVNFLDLPTILTLAIRKKVNI